MKINFFAGFFRHLSVLAIAGIIMMSSCKKELDQEQTPASPIATVSTDGFTINTKCLPSEILMEYPRINTWDEELFQREAMYKIQYDSKKRPANAVDKLNQFQFTFQYDPSGNLRGLKMYDNQRKIYTKQWSFSYRPGSVNSFSSEVKTIQQVYNSDKGGYKTYTSMRYYRSDGKLIRYVPYADYPDAYSIFFTYDAAGNLKEASRKYQMGDPVVIYRFKSYDNNPTAVSSHYVWQFLSGIHSKNNPGWAERFPGEYAQMEVNFNYTYGANGYPVKTMALEPGSTYSPHYLIATFPCPVIQPIPIPQPIPINIPAAAPGN